MRRKEEFYCTECRQYFLTYLRTNMFGDYTVECPNPKCLHHHHRTIREGLVTQDRHSCGGTVEILVGLRATLRATPWHDDPAWRRSEIHSLPGGAA